MKRHAYLIPTLTLLCWASISITLGNEPEMLSLRVASAQIPVTRSITENSATIHRALAVAIEEGMNSLELVVEDSDLD